MCTLIRFVTFLFLVLSASQLGIHYRIAQYKIVQDCLGLHAVDSGFHGLDSSICQWTLDFGFQSFVEFRIPLAVLWIPKPGIPDSSGKIFLYSWISKRNPDLLYMGITAMSRFFVTLIKTQKSTLQSKKTLE